MLALNSQMCATSATLSYFHVHTAINILRCFGYPCKRTQLWACFNTEPNRLYRRLRLFPSKLQEYTPPPFSRLSTQYHIDPLLTCFLSSRTSLRLQLRVQSSVTGILRMGDMNIHITWLTHVRTAPPPPPPPPKKKKSRPGHHSLVPRPHPLTRRNGLVNQVEFLGLAGALATV